MSKRNLNRIIAHVRSGGGCSTDDFNHLCDLVTEAWNRCVNDGNTPRRPTELHGIFVMGSIVAGTEAGFSLPPVSLPIQCVTFLVGGLRIGKVIHSLG